MIKTYNRKNCDWTDFDDVFISAFVTEFYKTQNDTALAMKLQTHCQKYNENRLTFPYSFYDCEYLCHVPPLVVYVCSKIGFHIQARHTLGSSF